MSEPVAIVTAFVLAAAVTGTVAWWVRPRDVRPVTQLRRRQLDAICSPCPGHAARNPARETPATGLPPGGRDCLRTRPPRV